jgi:hypothetical protein
MRKYLGSYVPTYAPKFKQQIATLDIQFVNQIKSKISNLIDDPYHNTEFGKGQHRGRRKARLNKSDRLIFVICEECRALKHTRFNGCSDCSTTPENTIVIAYLILGHEY